MRDTWGLGREDETMEIPADHIDVGDDEISVVAEAGRTHATRRDGA